MKTMKKYLFKTLLPALLLLISTMTAFAQQNGFMVIAPDRGFMGNEEIRDLHKDFSENYTSSLAFITEEDTDRFLLEAISHLEEQGVGQLVVLPLFLSDDHPLYKLAKDRLDQAGLTELPVEFGKTLHQNYLTAEILADRIESLSQNSSEEALILVAEGASDEAEKEAIKQDVERLVHINHGRFHFQQSSVVVFDNSAGRSESSMKELEAELQAASENELTPVVIPFDLTQKLDGMMAFSSRIGRVMSTYNAQFDGKDLTPHENVELWLAKQANGWLPVTKENLGVIFMPHGSNYNWNRTMMDAIDELRDEYLIEHAFSMGDPDLIENAVRKLEARGATAITVLRIFSLESSFKEATEFTLGLRDQMAGGGHMHGMGGVPPRVISSSEFYTTGGLEDSPLFAEALLDRAVDLSKNPEKETVILVGHGTRSEEGNKRWQNNLASIAAHMEATANEKGIHFRDFKFENWREDWPQLREESIANVREMVTEASEGDGTAIVIPARTTRGGHAQRWLSDLEFEHNGEGFAPHPLFVEWVDGLIQESLHYFNDGKEAGAAQVSNHSGSPSQHHSH